MRKFLCLIGIHDFSDSGDIVLIDENESDFHKKYYETKICKHCKIEKRRVPYGKDDYWEQAMELHPWKYIKK